MFLFVIGHSAGNLQVFLGPEAINHYGKLLRTWPELLWAIRSALLLALVLHVIFTMWIVIENRKVRPVKYAKKNSVQTKVSTRLMAITGLLLLGFIIFHLMHFTTHDVKPEYDGFFDEHGRHDVFRMIVTGFSNPAFSIFYPVSMIMLCSHLSHGAWSWLQTVGLRTRSVAGQTTRGAQILALVLAIGYISIPAAVMLGYGREYRLQRERAGNTAPLTEPPPGPVLPAQPEAQ